MQHGITFCADSRKRLIKPEICQRRATFTFVKYRRLESKGESCLRNFTIEALGVLAELASSPSFSTALRFILQKRDSGTLAGQCTTLPQHTADVTSFSHILAVILIRELINPDLHYLTAERNGWWNFHENRILQSNMKNSSVPISATQQLSHPSQTCTQNFRTHSSRQFSKYDLLRSRTTNGCRNSLCSSP